MFALVVTLAFGLAFAFFATSNTEGTTLRLAQYSLNHVPLYLIVLGSLLVGAALAFVIDLVDTLSSFFALRKRETLISELKKTVAELIKRVHALEIAQEGSDGKSTNEKQDDLSL